MSERHHWPNKWIFILAAIGSAAGLGNLWRFPFLAYEYGGGAFVFAIIIANLAIGIPLLLAEVAIGQKMQKGAPDALGQIKPKLRFLGWAMVLFGILVMGYYVAVMGWGAQYILSSFQFDAWSGQTSAFFFESVLQLSDGVDQIGGLAWPVIVGVVISFIAIYFSIWKGVKSVSKVVTWSATLPFVLLGILLIRAVTLEGAGDGLQAFLVPDWSALANPELWIAALSQAFFSLSVAFGVMMAYGSFNPEKSELTKSVVLIAIGNFAVSFLSGIVIFGTLGYMAFQQGIPITEVVAGGPSLAFVVFPEAISLLPSFASLFAILFFVMFFLLALDSAFSLVEGLATAFRDRMPHVSSKKISLWLIIVIFIMSLLYSTQAGLYYLDITDHFMVFYAIVLSGLFLSLVAGWSKMSKELRQFIKENSEWHLGKWFDVSVKFITPIFLIYLLGLNIYNEFQSPYEGYPTWALMTFGLLPIVLALIVGVILDKLTRVGDSSLTPKEHASEDMNRAREDLSSDNNSTDNTLGI